MARYKITMISNYSHKTHRETGKIKRKNKFTLTNGHIMFANLLPVDFSITTKIPSSLVELLNKILWILLMCKHVKSQVWCSFLKLPMSQTGMISRQNLFIGPDFH